MSVGHNPGMNHLVIWKQRWKWLAAKLLEIKAETFTYGDKN